MTSQDPERYSVDDMMERLKRPTGEETGAGGVLVTRADGTQMMKVRRRKRRSEQGGAEAASVSHRVRVLQLAAAVSLVVILLLAGFGMLAYFNSNGFIAQTEDTVGGITGADIEIRQFALSPVRARAQIVEAAWPEGGFLAAARFAHLGAKINPHGFVGGRWGGEEVSAQEGTLRLRAAETGSPSAPGNSVFPYDFMRYRCQSLTTHFGTVPSQAPAVVKSEASLYRQSPGINQIRLSGGSLRLPGWGEFPLDRGHLEVRGNQVEISSFRVADTLNGRGELALSGVLALGATTTSSLDLVFTDFPLSDIVGSRLSRLIDGRIRSEAMVVFDPSDFSSLELTAGFKASPQEDLRLSGLPVFDRLKTEFQEPFLGRPSFSSVAEGVVKRSATGIELNSLRLERRNVMAVVGNMGVDSAGNLSGTLDIGISDRLLMISSAPGVRQAFGEQRDGYNWVTVTLGGTVASPRDDFAERLAGQLPDSATPVLESPEDALERQFDELTR